MLTVATPRANRHAPKNRRGSYALTPKDPHITATTSCWASRNQWLTIVTRWATSPAAAPTLALCHISAKTLTRVAHLDATYAEAATGRMLTTSKRTAATKLGISEKTVQRARKALRTAGLMVLIATGRYLTRHERAEAAHKHGGTQDRAANTWHLSVPSEYAHLAAENSDAGDLECPPSSLPSGRELLSPQSVVTKTRERAREHDHNLKKTTTTQKPRRTFTPPTPAGRKLAGRLVAIATHLSGGQHLNRLARALDANNLTGWQARELIDAIYQRNKQAGTYTIPINNQRDPIALFIHEATRATDGLTPPHITQRARDAAREARNKAMREADEQARREAVAPTSTYRSLRAALRSRRGMHKHATLTA